MQKAVVVLGGGNSRKDLNQETKERLRAGALHFKCTNYDNIIVTDAFIGRLMGEFLVSEENIPAELVIVDDKALDTFQNRDNVVEICQSRGIDSITVVTSDYHMPVARLLFRANFRSVELLSVKLVCPPRLRKRFFYHWVYPIYVLLDPKGKKWLAKRVQQKRTKWLA